MSWDNNCVDCDKKISDDYERCYDCNEIYNNEELPIVYQELDGENEKCWFVVINKEKVTLPKSQCTLDKESSKVYVPRWLAEKKEID